MKQFSQRGALTGSMWWIMCATWISFLGQQAADVERFSGTPALVALRCLPLMLFIWFAVLDSLRLLIWYELVLLFTLSRLLRRRLPIRLMSCRQV